MADILSTAFFYLLVIVFGVFAVLIFADAFREGGVSQVQSMVTLDRKSKSNSSASGYNPLSEFTI